MKITVDPNTDASGFGHVEAGEYTLRIVSVEHKEGQKAPYLAWKCELADPNIQGVDGKKPGSIFENTTLKSGDNSQFRLRQLCDALGVPWGDFDTEDCIGVEFQAQLAIKEYNGALSNEIKQFIPKG